MTSPTGGPQPQHPSAGGGRRVVISSGVKAAKSAPPPESRRPVFVPPGRVDLSSASSTFAQQKPAATSAVAGGIGAYFSSASGAAQGRSASRGLGTSSGVRRTPVVSSSSSLLRPPALRPAPVQIGTSRPQSAISLSGYADAAARGGRGPVLANAVGDSAVDPEQHQRFLLARASFEQRVAVTNGASSTTGPTSCQPRKTQSRRALWEEWRVDQVIRGLPRRRQSLREKQSRMNQEHNYGAMKTGANATSSRGSANLLSGGSPVTPVLRRGEPSMPQRYAASRHQNAVSPRYRPISPHVNRVPDSLYGGIAPLVDEEHSGARRPLQPNERGSSEEERSTSERERLGFCDEDDSEEEEDASDAEAGSGTGDDGFLVEDSSATSPSEFEPHEQLYLQDDFHSTLNQWVSKDREATRVPSALRGSPTQLPGYIDYSSTGPTATTKTLYGPAYNVPRAGNANTAALEAAELQKYSIEMILAYISFSGLRTRSKRSNILRLFRSQSREFSRFLVILFVFPRSVEVPRARIKPVARRRP
ncbi:unnamed protein product [Amoebophrya sp. A25]|nr:unnamed protein product [Amoebophrya sp. A25]|eukprot:GSA25T00011746001.1